MFHRLLGLGLLLLVCFTGCSLRDHRGCNCQHHGRMHRQSANPNTIYNPHDECTCPAPLYPGDQQCQGNCRKHKRQRPLRRTTAALRRNSKHWLTGLSGSGSDGGCCSDECCIDGQMAGPQMMGQPVMYAQNGCVQPAWGTQQSCCCDSCSMSVSNGWFEDGVTSEAWFNDSASSNSSGCGCGESQADSGPVYMPEQSEAYEYSADSPAMNIPVPDHTSHGPRSFPPTSPHSFSSPNGSPGNHNMESAPTAPTDQRTVPMPQDMTPIDPMVLPRTNPNGFDPTEDAAPPADRAVDPISYELPRLPPIPERVHYSTFRRLEAQHFRPIQINSQQSLQ